MFTPLSAAFYFSLEAIYHYKNLKKYYEKIWVFTYFGQMVKVKEAFFILSRFFLQRLSALSLTQHSINLIKA